MDYRADRPVYGNSAHGCAYSGSDRAPHAGPNSPSLTDRDPVSAPIEAATGPDYTADSALLLTATLRAGALAYLLFQIAYTVLGATSFAATFDQTLPLHILSMALGVAAMLVTLWSGMIRYWRRVMFGFCTAMMLVAALIGAINHTHELLVVTVLLFFVGAGVLVPWSVRWQFALTAAGLAILAAASLHTTDSAPKVAITWMLMLTVALVALIGTSRNDSFRSRQQKHLKALAEDQRLLRREIELRTEVAAAHERGRLSLQKNSAMLRKVFDAASDIIVVTRVSDGSYIDFNRQFQRFGYTGEDLEESRAGLRRIWASDAQRREIHECVARDGSVSNVEVEFLTPRGETIPTLLSAVAVELNGEQCVVTMVRDVSAAKDSARKLEESSRTVKEIFGASPDAISVMRISDGKYVAVNEEFLRTGGYTREEVIGFSDRELGVWHNLAERERFSAALAATGEVRNLEVEFCNRRSPRTPMLISAALISLDGEPCVVAYVRDITALKRTETELRTAREALSHQIEALRESENTFRKLFYANLDSMTLTGSDGRFIDVNPEYTRLTGYSREESIGRHFSDFNMWIEPDQMIAYAGSLAANHEVRNLEVSFRLKDGSVLEALVSAVNLELYGQLCCLTVTRGIADLKRTQRELVAASEAALAASRAKSEFLSSMSHEIRTPMNAILGMSDLIAETELTSEQRGLLNTIISNGNSLLELINGILDLARVESGRMNLEAVAFDLREAVEKVVETLAIRAREKGLALTMRFAPEVPGAVVGDPLRLSQILINLVGNAVKFTAKGVVSVGVERVLASGANPTLKFTVADTGIGIPGRDLELLFRPFTQADSSTSRRFGGSGLGLAIVARLVAMMSGEVTVQSREGVGSEFSFTAQFGAAAEATAPVSGIRSISPDAALPTPASTDIKVAAAPIVDRPLRILVADDSPDNRALIEAYLKKTTYLIEKANDGQEAVDQFVAGRFDLVLMDIQMPNVDGYQATREIRDWERVNRRARTPVVALTASALEGAADQTRAAGCDAHITKPVKKSTLLKAIHDAVEPQSGPTELREQLTEVPCRTE